MESRRRRSTSRANAGTLSSKAATYRNTTRACLRSAANAMITPRSPGASTPRQSLKQARYTHTSAATLDLPPRLPTIAHASLNAPLGASCRPVWRRNTSSPPLGSGSPNSVARNVRHPSHDASANCGPNSAGESIASRIECRDSVSTVDSVSAGTTPTAALASAWTFEACFLTSRARAIISP